ncbi:MAG: histidine--tRNA ligase [Candidatus Auribacterota bacterium]|nr:histidine--tRNA ligase [Candidatus Auribacterota bacterium]
MTINALRGTYDICPPASYIWEYVEQEARRLFGQFGYGEIRTPIFEETRLFTRSIGENTDIVSKEMYTFADRKGRSITLRPEATAPVVRAFLQHKLYSVSPLNKFFYIGPMFRYERPQAGRNRQFYQLGTEILGSNHPYYDAESIALAHQFLCVIGINNPTVKINSVGDLESKKLFGKMIQTKLMPQQSLLCADCQTRLEKNPLRVLDCKNPSCKEYIKDLPRLTDNLSPASKEHFAQVLRFLDSMNIPYVIDNCLVRGLDYYTETIFEIVHSNLGSQDALGGGGRYNNLVEEMEGPSTGAVGFAFGIDRLVMVLEQLRPELATDRQQLDCYILNLEPSVFTEHVALVHKLRKTGIRADICTEEKSMKAQFRAANKLNARFVVIRGKEEIEKNIFSIKNMNEANEEKISYTDENTLFEILRERIIKL